MGDKQGQGEVRLNAVQEETLRHVLAHRSSKEIARIMGVSPHTVDARIKTAIRLLGVASRSEAALLLAQRDGGAPYQPLIYQSPELQSTPLAAEDALVPGGAGTARRFWLGAPFPTRDRPYNMHGQRERILWPILIAFGTIMAFAALYSVLLGLGEMLT